MYRDEAAAKDLTAAYQKRTRKIDYVRVQYAAKPEDLLHHDRAEAPAGRAVQRVQQALLLLKNQGLVREFGRRGLEVTPLDAASVSHLYQLRVVLDGYAARCSAVRITPDGLRRGRELVGTGQRAYQEHNYSVMITADVEFHRLLVEEAGNPLLVESTGPIWRNVQRVMGEVLYRGDTPAWVWRDHADILDAVEAGDADRAEELARSHAERLILDGMAAPGRPTVNER